MCRLFCLKQNNLSKKNQEKGGLVRAHFILGLIVAAGAVSCALPPAKMQTPFDEKMHKPYTESGTNTIKGQAFLRQMGGGVVTCAGSDVVLMPATSFFREAIGIFASGRKLAPLTAGLPTAYQSIIKKSQCDAQGNFAFTGLPSGNWFVGTTVSWTAGYQPQGGDLFKEASVSNGETAQVLLTDSDRLR
jgi:hypothetical protein